MIPDKSRTPTKATALSPVESSLPQCRDSERTTLNADCWQTFESADLGTRGWRNPMRFEKFGDFQVLAASYGVICSIFRIEVDLKNLNWL